MGLFIDAHSNMQRSLDIYEQKLGPNHPDIAFILNNMASIYQDLHKYDNALTFYERALLINEEHLGHEDLEVAQVLHNLAALYFDMGKYLDSLPLYHRAFEIREMLLESDDSDLLSTANKLIILYKTLNMNKEASQLKSKISNSRASHKKICCVLQ